MVLLTMTPGMIEALQAYHSNPPSLAEGPTLPCEPSLENAAAGDPISHCQLVEIAKHLRKQAALREELDLQPRGQPSYHLDDLLRGSRVFIPPAKPKAEPTPEYKALMARLRREEEARAYERMISPQAAAESFAGRYPKSPYAELFPAATQAINDDDEITYADINRQMALILNILVSIVACSVAIWIAASHWSTPKRLGLSMSGSGIVAVAEVVVYAGYLRRVKEAKEKGKKEVETKEIIKSWVISSAAEKTDQSALVKDQAAKPLVKRRMKPRI